jgi:hypothetical protein
MFFRDLKSPFIHQGISRQAWSGPWHGERLDLIDFAQHPSAISLLGLGAAGYATEAKGAGAVNAWRHQ